MAKILITGGAGYIGAHAVYAFGDDNHLIGVIDNHSAGVYPHLPSSARFWQGDFGDEKFIQSVMKEFAPDVVLHFAGSIIVSESVAKPDLYYYNNTQKSINLIRACLAQGVQNFIFSSTAAVYGIPQESILREDSPKQPINPYGWSKLMIEQVLADCAKAYDFRYAVLRYFNVAGADDKKRCGQSSTHATHLIKIACQAALGQREHIEIFGTDYATPDGTCVRDYIHISDLIKAHQCAYDYIRRHKKSAIFNCGRGQGFSVREVIDAVRQISAKPIKMIDSPRRLGDPPFLVTDPSFLSQETGWVAQRSLEDMISSALDWERKLESDEMAK